MYKVLKSHNYVYCYDSLQSANGNQSCKYVKFSPSECLLFYLARLELLELQSKMDCWYDFVFTAELKLLGSGVLSPR